MVRSTFPQLQLADQLYLAAHEHTAQKMRERLHPAVLSVGLAGALLAELMIGGSISRRDGYLLGPGHRVPSADLVGTDIAQRISNEPSQPVQAWLSQLSGVATDHVRTRLCTNGVLSEARARRWWGGTATVYEANDMNLVQYPEVELVAVVNAGPRDRPTLQAVTLAGLASAIGLFAKLDSVEHTATVGQRLADLRSGLPVPMRGLLADTEAAAGAVLLSMGYH